jgi:hypothetical protein
MTTPPPRQDPATVVKRLIRMTFKAALGTLNAPSRTPYVSLVLLATDTGGAPLMLLSGLAVHTRNLTSDAAASLLIDATGGHGDPMAGARVSLVGRANRTADENARHRFLLRHPEAAAYAGFADFAIFRFEPESAHLVEGFGRIVDVPGSQLRTSTVGFEKLVELEREVTAARPWLARDHQGARWRVAGLDPEGIDLVCDGVARRLEGSGAAASLTELRSTLVQSGLTLD